MSSDYDTEMKKLKNWYNAPVSKTAKQYIERQRWMSGYYD